MNLVENNQHTIDQEQSIQMLHVRTLKFRAKNRQQNQLILAHFYVKHLLPAKIRAENWPNVVQCV